MTRKRRYGQFCGLAKSLDIVGGRWTLLIVRNLVLGPLRYTDLLEGLPGITTNLLAQRLDELEDEGVIETANAGYALTRRGLALEPAIHALGAWGQAYMDHPRRGEVSSPDWGLVALKRRYRGTATSIRVELTIDGAPYTMVLRRDRVDIQRGAALGPDLSIEGAWSTLAPLFYRGASADELRETGQLTVTGPTPVFRRFVRSFGLTR